VWTAASGSGRHWSPAASETAAGPEQGVAREGSSGPWEGVRVHDSLVGEQGRSSPRRRPWRTAAAWAHEEEATTPYKGKRVCRGGNASRLRLPRPFTPRYDASLGRRARGKEAWSRPAGTGVAADRRGGAWHVAGETSRRLGVCACVAKRVASGGAGGPDGEAGAARDVAARRGWPEIKPLQPCLNALNSKNLNRSAQRGE
jgi:hypothetical protein